MRVTLRRILAVLDGAPTGTRGQSLVELTLTLPILLVMLLGLTEIGWYADHYLTLLDVVREAGRAGSTRPDVMLWPDGDEKNYNRMDCDTDPITFNTPTGDYTSPPGPDLSAWGYTIGDERPEGYYDGVACSVLRNMAPLEFNDKTDDIVVSVFSFFLLNPDTTPQVRIYGRYPARANECQNDDQYDPFDWNHDGLGGSMNEDPGFFDSGSDNVRGYVFRGNHQSDSGASVKCLGSEYSTLDIEKMLDFQGDPDRARKIQRVQNNGLVLVEIYWDHHQLFGLPWFNFGPLENAQTIHVWAFFPVTAAEPDINF
jgi:hypothetical protein